MTGNARISEIIKRRIVVFVCFFDQKRPEMQVNIPALAQMHDDSGMAGFRERILRQNGELFYKIVRFVTVYRTNYALTGLGATHPALLATPASPE